MIKKGYRKKLISTTFNNKIYNKKNDILSQDIFTLVISLKNTNYICNMYHNRSLKH